MECGAIGGRTVLKPSEVPYKNCERYPKKNHLDYGVLAYQQETIGKQSLDKFTNRIRENNPDWPNLKNFWFVKGAYMNRAEHNTIVKRNQIKPKYYANSASEIELFLGGYIKESGKKVIPANLQTEIHGRHTQSDGESKKIFSFHGLIHCDDEDCVRQDFSPRCFGYVRNDVELTDMTTKVKRILDAKEGCIYEFKKGPEVLNDL